MLPTLLYDKHGNIKALERWGKTTTGATYGRVDSLTIYYNGNQLTRVNDSGTNVTIPESGDFKNATNVAIEYTYNKNGAMTKDLNKGITGISYNSLNLPLLLSFSNTKATGNNTYTYLADGRKVKVIQKLTSPSASTLITEYIGNKVYENGVLKRTLIEGGYIEGTAYFFYLTDHLGNNRVVANTSGVAMQKNHYDPFGVSFAEVANAEQDKQPYKYNGKELDRVGGLNLYDYGARHYEPALGRFMTMDPLSEKYYSVSPYAYCLNNPLRFVDPDGEDIIDAIRGFAHGLIGHDQTRPTSLQRYTTDTFGAKVYTRSQGDNLERMPSGNRTYEAGYTTGETAAFIADMAVGYITTGQKVISAAKEGVESYFSKKSGTTLVQTIPEKSLTNQEAREVYNQFVKGINTNISPTKSNAMRVVSQRNDLKQAVREMMSDGIRKNKIDAKSPIQPFEYYYKKYYDKGFRGEELYKEIINKGITPNKEVNKVFGIN